jgi:hypothetical protein
MFYRLRQAIHYIHFRYVTRAIRESPPLPCDPKASCNIHTMLSAHDFPLYLVAIKSFLRYYQSVGVVVHSDGSLTERHETILRRHVPGCTILRAIDMDNHAREIIGTDSYLAQWRAIDVSWRRLVDTEIWNPCGKRIIMDSDILIMRRPDEVIAWIEQDESPRLMGRQPDDPTPLTATLSVNVREHVQTIFKRKLQLLSDALALPNQFLDGSTGGFYCCGRELTLLKVEQLLRASMGLGIPMREWGGEQCTVIYLLSVAGGRRFDPKQYINFDPCCAGHIDEVVLAHFFGTYRFYKQIYPIRAARIARDLAMLPAAASGVEARPPRRQGSERTVGRQ